MSKEETQKILDEAVELSTGIPADELRRMTLHEIRELSEKKHGKPMRIVSGSRKLLTREQINDMVDEAIAYDPDDTWLKKIGRFFRRK